MKKIVIQNLHIHLAAEPVKPSYAEASEKYRHRYLQAQDFREALRAAATRHGFSFKDPSEAAHSPAPAAPAPAPRPPQPHPDDVPSDAWQQIVASRPQVTGWALEALHMMFRMDPPFVWRVLMSPKPAATADPESAPVAPPSVPFPCKHCGQSVGPDQAL